MDTLYDISGSLTPQTAHEFRLAATKRERCNLCVPMFGFHDEFAHMSYLDGGNPFHHFNERVYREHNGLPDPYPDCTFRMRLIA